MEKIQIHTLGECVRLTNDSIEVVVTIDVGPRIIKYALSGDGENVLGEHPEARVETALGEFKPYGGHRLWIAPENIPNSYAPDNVPIKYFFDKQKNSLRLVQPIEIVTKTQKEMIVSLDETGSGVMVNHKITNCSEREIELAAWALTILRGGGEVFVPNEPFAPYAPETLLPVRNLTCWSYTDLSDSRWRFDRDFIRLRVDEDKSEPQKIGVLNKAGWAMYRVGGWQFIKRFEFHENAAYPDMNSNTELYTAGGFVEVETLSPLKKLAPGDSIEHGESWELSFSDEIESV